MQIFFCLILYVSTQTNLIKEHAMMKKQRYIFCPKCKNKLVAERHTEKHCNICGSLLIRECPKCHKSIMLHDTQSLSHCTECGANLFSAEEDQ